MKSFKGLKKIASTNIIFLLIIIIASVLRLSFLTSVPPSLYWDEVSQGYNAYSLLRTGRDEHGEFLPIARLKAFGDYKAPVYTYSIIPFMAFLGKSDVAVRLPSALFGIGSVLLTFFFVRLLFLDNKQKERIGLFASFFLAVSPWHIQLSRAAYEANCATFFTLLAVLLFFLSLHKKKFLLILSAVSFVIAMYAFNAHRVFIPLFVILLGVVFIKQLLTMKRMVLFAGIVGFVMLIPLFMFLQTPEGKLRFSEVNIFSNLDIIKHSNEFQQQEGDTLFAKAIHNRRVEFGILYMSHYFDFFNPSFLFISGDVNPRFSLRDTGQLYIFMLPLILMGMYYVTQHKTKISLLLFGWLLLAPIVGATARETPHALRGMTFIPLYEIFAAVGFVGLFTLLKKTNINVFKSALTIFAVVVLLQIFIFLHNYFTHFPKEFSFEWQYGYREAIEEAEKMKNNYDVVAVSDQYGRPYTYALFYGSSKPSDYWNSNNIKKDIFGFYNVYGFDKYEFRPTTYLESDNNKKVLYVASPHELPVGLHILNKIYFLNGGEAFIIADNL